MDSATPERLRPQRERRPRTTELAGVVVVVAAENRRAAVLRCLESLRDSHEHRADIVFVGTAGPDRSTEMIRERFRFVRVVDRAEDALQPASLEGAPPRFVLSVSPDVTLDRVTVRALVRAIACAPPGTVVAPVLTDPQGRTIDLPPAAAAPVWGARRRDLAHGAPETVRVRRDIAALVPRPDELVERLAPAPPVPR